MMKAALRVLVGGLVLALCWAVEAHAQSRLTLDKPLYVVSTGSSVDGIAHIIASSWDAGGYLHFYTNTPSVATVSPTQVTLVLGPQGYVEMFVPFTLTGVSGGSTIVKVDAYSPVQPGSPFLTAFSNVTVIDCPVSLTLEGEPDSVSNLGVIYDFRDRVMRRTKQGREYIRTFYWHAWEGSYLLLRHQALRDQTRAVLQSLLPTIGAAVQGRRAVLTAQDIANVEALLQEVSAYASPELQQAIGQLMYDLNDGWTLSLFGFTRERSR